MIYILSSGNKDFVKGKRVVVIGRSKIVGSPAAALFMWHNGTTTICHSRTENLPEICKKADILVVAIGKERFVKVNILFYFNNKNTYRKTGLNPELLLLTVESTSKNFQQANVNFWEM